DLTPHASWMEYSPSTANEDGEPALQLLGVGEVVRISAQARATSKSAALLPGMVAKPLFSMTLARSHELVLIKASVLTIASGWLRNRSAQIGANAATVASWAAAVAL